MFGCFKISARKTYVVNKPVPGAGPSRDASPPRNSSSKASSPKRKVTKHSLHEKRPSVEEDKDTSQPQIESVPIANERQLTSSIKPDENGIEKENKSSLETHIAINEINENLKIENETDPKVKIETQTTENTKTEKVNNENEDDSLDKNQVEVEQVSNIIKNDEEIVKEDETRDNIKNTQVIAEIETVKVDDIKDRTEPNTAGNISESSSVKTNSEEKSNTEIITVSTPLKSEAADISQQSTPLVQVETNQRNARSENEENHQPIIVKSQTETIREHQEAIHVQSEIIQVHGDPPLNAFSTQTRNHQNQNETMLGTGHQQITVFAIENKNIGDAHGNIVHRSPEMSTMTNGIQNGHLMNGVHNEVEFISEVVKVQKTEGVKFVEDVDVMIYEDSDSDSIYEGGVDDAGLPKERREGVRETVKIDDDQDIRVHPKSEQEALDIKKAFLANEFLETVLKDDQLNTLVDAMYLREVEENEVIIQEGEPGNHLYVSAGGTFDVYVNQKKVNSFSDFRVFGELAILYNAKRMATIKSTTTGRIWVLHRSIYQRTLVQDAIRDYEEMLSFLQNVPTVNMIKIEKLRKIANLLKKEFFKTDTVIVQQGDMGDKFYIIRAGNVTVTRKDEGKVAELSKGAYFGERALLQEDCRQATVTADPPGVECLTLTRTEFKEHFDDDYFSQSGNDQQSQLQLSTESKEPGEFAEIQLDELKRVETLGVGGFGRVELVQHRKQPNLTFALKYLKKVDMVQQGQVDHVFNEKNIQISCNSVFVVRMYKTFSDNKYLYFLMESCLGGDLWTFLQRQKGRHVGDSSARFFAGCVLEALTYLHDREYIYRDLKPENLIIDNNGYIKLTDFGFAKYIGRNGRTFTFAGTPEYVAPEIVYNRGHDKAVDYWAFGIFIYELLVGRTPFRSDDPSHMRTYNRILKGINSVQFPPNVSKPAISIIRKLCKAIPTERLGCQKNGAQDIRNHKWFQPLDWNKLRNRKVKAPFAPKLQSNIDTKFFEKFKPDDDVPPDELAGFDDFES